MLTTVTYSIVIGNGPVLKDLYVGESKKDAFKAPDGYSHMYFALIFRTSEPVGKLIQGPAMSSTGVEMEVEANVDLAAMNVMSSRMPPPHGADRASICMMPA